MLGPGLCRWGAYVLCGAMTHVRSLRAPDESALAPLYPGADLLDAFAVRLAPEVSGDMDALARALMAHPAWWARALTAIRDTAVRPFGVKTTVEIARTAAAHGHETFPVLQRTANERIAGVDDAHLDVRASLLIREDGAGRELVIISVVHCHNRFGRVYLRVIAPFHRAMVRANLRRAAERGWPI